MELPDLEAVVPLGVDMRNGFWSWNHKRGAHLQGLWLWPERHPLPEGSRDGNGCQIFHHFS